MNEADLLDRVFTGIRGFVRLCAAAEGASCFERSGVIAAVNPATPDRSLFNAVVADGTMALEPVYEELAKLYERAGVDAWTVFVHESDRDLTAMLEARGHSLDASPTAMGMALEGLVPRSLSGLEVSTEFDPEAICVVSDRAYELPPGTFARGVRHSEGFCHVARLDGEPAAVVLSTDFDGDCCVLDVATLPEAQGRGLAGALLAMALVDARERGRETTTLWATKAGHPLYVKLGYRHLGAAQMWERRKTGSPG